MAKEVLDTIMSIQPKDSSGGSGETRESRVFRIATDMLEKLPDDYVPHEVSHNLSMLATVTSALALGEGKAAEDGYSVKYEHIPEAGGGQDAASAQSGPLHSARLAAGH